jgi:NAD-dependent deacetylase
VQAQPNPAHLSLAALQRAGLVRTIVTQNIDGLHQRAGARRVLELHGHLRRATCLQCRHRLPASGLLQAILATAAVPRCPRCGGLVKPDVILFGEVLPAGVLRKAERETLASDLVWVIGSSLTVVPASLLPSRALDNGARLIVVNRTPTPLDHRAEVVLRDDVAQALPAIAAVCLARSSSSSPPDCGAPS